MTPNDIKNAYKAIQELSGTVFPYKVSRSVSALKKRLSEELETVAAMEMALVEKYGGSVLPNGSVRVVGANSQAFADEFNAMMWQNDESIVLPVADVSEQADIICITPGAVAALEGLVIFEKEN
jgi:hypothetical protein